MLAQILTDLTLHSYQTSLLEEEDSDLLFQRGFELRCIQFLSYNA